MYLLNLPWWVRDIVALVLLTHMTSVSITLYLHRYVTHGALVLHPFVQWLFRAWLWLNTGMGTKDWVGVHTWHHATVDTADDPHSPRYFGVWGIVAGGVLRYRAAVNNRAKIAYYTDLNPRVPRDKWEQRLFAGPFHHWGVAVLLALDIMIFWHTLPREESTSSLFTSYFLSALPGIVIWLVQIAWTPLFAAGVINGFGHAVGYRNYDTPDDSRNVPLTPILEFLTTGENFHNNHHKDPENPKFSWNRASYIVFIFPKAQRPPRFRKKLGGLKNQRKSWLGALRRKSGPATLELALSSLQQEPDQQEPE